MAFLKYASFFIPPLIALLIYVYLRYKFTKWSFSLLFKSFIWGMASIFLVLLVQIAANYLELDKLNNIRRILFYALVIMAFFSELGKYLILRGLVYPKEVFKTPVDGIILAVMISMGFATMNNILYFINIPDLTVNIANALTAGPANVIFGVMMGFFIGLGKLRKMRFIDSMTGLAAAVFFHALYDFCLLTKDYKLLWAFFIGATIIAISLCFAALRIHQDARAEEKF
ncbi:MAG: PrsW family glutamic-type intramembrane protease [Bacteroidales bacterium]|nr:PrsW family glutamic-type intramembrane protease [Bacteroidales bacterium]